jgi:dienelactone hydrolase
VSRWRAAAAAFLAVACGGAGAQQYLLNLTLPQGASPPYPAVILLHGCSGILDNQPMWQVFLASKGYASASVDSLTRRHVSEICTDSTRVRMPDRVRDAYAALVELAARPDIDPKRVAVMGFSNGGLATLSALSSIVQAQLVPGSPHFRAGVALYPDCSLYRGPFAVPILTVTGGLDDWTPAADCEALAAQIPAGRPQFIARTIANAHHSFDTVHQQRYYYGNARNMHKSGGYGATVEGNYEATEEAERIVADFLARELAPQ